MTHPAYLREKAIELRRKDMTIDEIAERLAMPRGTIYSWVRDIEITRKPGWKHRTEAQTQGTKAMQRSFAAKRDYAYQCGRTEFASLAEDPTFRDFVCLYIGEGYKRCRNRVSIANSDPLVVELAHRWIKELTTNKMSWSIQYHADQNLGMLKEFWASRLRIEPEEIRFQRKSNSNHLTGRTWRSEFGVLTVTANDTQLRARIEGWIDEMKKSWLDSTLPGRGEVWLSHSVWGRKNVGSNPTAPISPLTTTIGASERAAGLGFHG